MKVQVLKLCCKTVKSAQGKYNRKKHEGLLSLFNVYMQTKPINNFAKEVIWEYFVLFF